jgi:hypothetical protein
MQRTIGLAVWLGFIAVGFCDSAEMVSVTDLAGVVSTGRLQSWSLDRLQLTGESPRDFARAEIRSVHFDRPGKRLTRTMQTTPTIWLSNGDQISARAISADENFVTASWSLLGAGEPIPIPLEKVVAIVFEWPLDPQERLRLIADLETIPKGNDVVLLTNGDRFSGEFERFEAAHLQLKVGPNSLKLDRSRVRALRFNPELTTLVRPQDRRSCLTFDDGSHLTVSECELVDETLQVQSGFMGKRSLPVHHLLACHLFGERVIPLADREPTKVEFTPYLSVQWPLVRNANVRRGPLTLRGIEFVTGLGMHSRMAVTYPLKGSEQEFRATVGIDDLAGGGGSVRFGVDLDGERVWTSAELKGDTAAVKIPVIKLQGHQQLTLVVDYGEFADVLDYADWCDAVLIVDPVP